jgi:hypothetical protein
MLLLPERQTGEACWRIEQQCGFGNWGALITKVVTNAN